MCSISDLKASKFSWLEGDDVFVRRISFGNDIRKDSCGARLFGPHIITSWLEVVD